MYEKFEKLLEERGVTAYRVAKDTGINTATFTSWKQGKYTPKQDKLQTIADYFGKPLEYFTGTTSNDSAAPSDPYVLTPKDERDIAKQLEKMKESLESNMALSFHGEPIDDEDREALLASLENTLRLSKYMAKKKFTPNKYRKET
jgi:transcriptional regulator with XRE-family HTH domain